MASITSLMNSNYNTSSIYGNRNVLSGLASGMDTETMIENAVSGIKNKIQSLLQKRTKVEWQQEAYRSIIDKAVSLSNKYTSYTSKTNLLSSSFFNNAVITSVNGTYANKVSASGKTSSDIRINAVKQLATAATYSVSGSSMLGGDVSTITGGSVVDLSGDMRVSTISGSLTLKYGGSNGTSFDLDFDELENVDDVVVYNEDGTEKKNATNAEKLAQAIRNKLSEQTWDRTKNGVQETLSGSDVVDVQVDSKGNITFSDKLSEGNKVYISAAAGDIKSTLGVSTGSGNNTLKAGSVELSKKVQTRDNLFDKKLTLSLNGASKTIDMNDVMGKIDYSAKDVNQEFVNALQDEINSAFGKGKVEVSRGEDGKMSFKAMEDGSTLVLSGNAVSSLGFENGDANYINTSKTLRDLLGDRKSYDFQINGVTIKANGDTTLESLMSSINSNADAGVKVSYSKLTNEFKFTATETGSNSKIEFGGLAKEVFGAPEVSESSNFSEVYGLNMESGNRSITFPDPTDFFGESSIEITDNMTKDDIVNAINKKYAELGLQEQYEAVLDDKGKVVITDKTSGENINAPISKSVTFSIPGYGAETTFDVTGDMTMGDVVEQLNMMFNNSHTASIDERTGQIVMQDKETGQVLAPKITNDSDTVVNSDGKQVGQELKISFSCSYTAGTDAVMDVEINGKRFENLSRSSNSFDIDGMTINVKDTFGVDENGSLLSVDKDGNDIEAITFTTVTDSDKIIDAIRSFVNDYNEMVTELKGAYSTQPAYKSGTTRYEPLTAEQEAGYSESELAAYNEKAKQGILFGDTTLSSMYSKLLNAITPGGVDGQTLREIGIGTSYSNGLTTISLDEDKLRTALESDPDKVRNAFTKTTEGGSSGDGLMQTLQNTLNTYVKTTGEPKGVLITKAGSVKAPTSLNNNSLNTQINNLDKQIQRWQDKMSSQIDRYTAQFSKLEQLVAAMNSQAAALSGLMGGYEGY